MTEDELFRSVGGKPLAQGPGGEVTAWDFGWRPDKDAVANLKANLPHPTASTTPVADLPLESLPNEVFLWRAYEQLHGGKKPPARNQSSIGSCVSFGTGTAVERTMCCEITAGDPEEFKELAQEVIYGGSRVEVGGGRIRGDGSVGAWAAEFVKNWGVVARGVHGPHDLSVYRVSTCRTFGESGVPADLETLAREHPVTDVTQVETWADAKKMLAAGHGIAICSGQGFSMQRDSRGVCRASGSWAHCMCLDGYRVEGAVEFGHITNSWGPDAHTGPVGWGEPQTDGFWAESAVVARMLAQNDSWAFAGVRGWLAAVLPLWLI